MINHDDGNIPDLRTQRRIYNKYSFHCSVCAVFNPFNNLDDAKAKLVNYRKLIRDGHSVGLHAILDSSYWIIDRIYDVKPNGASNFAPLVSEMRGNNADGTGTNTFGNTITVNTKMSDIYTFSFLNVSDTLKNKKVVEITQSELDIINSQYVFYTDSYLLNGFEDLGIDIATAESAELVSKTRLQWLEYYLNGLVDDTLGYSSSASTLAARFAEDYDVPEGVSVGDYYPDAAHILNGKMVYYGDMENPHYAEAIVSTDANFTADSYQLVGKFKKGLYKDCFSTCNWEVMHRCIEAAQAFFRKYYGLEHFDEHHPHGVAYVHFPYQEENYYYMDRGKTILETMNAKFYSSLYHKKVSTIEIFSWYGMDAIRLFGTISKYMNYIGTIGGYYGQKGVKQSLFGFGSNGGTSFANFVNYMNSFGVGDSGSEGMDYNTFKNFIKGLDTGWLKYFFENAGSTVTRNNVTVKIYSYLKQMVMKVIESMETGRVPIISVDTIMSNPAVATAVDLFCRFCNDIGYEIVSLPEGKNRILNMDRDMSGNLFPNPSFKQTLLEYFGGNSSSPIAKVPDGWTSNYNMQNNAFAIETVEIEGVRYKALTLTKGDSSFNASTRIYGLKAGNYVLSFKVKGDENSRITIYKYYNKTIDGYASIYATASPTNSWEDRSINITIEEPHKNMQDDDSPVNIICGGYEDNVAYIEFGVSGNSVISLADISLKAI